MDGETIAEWSRVGWVQILPLLFPPGTLGQSLHLCWDAAAAGPAPAREHGSDRVYGQLVLWEAESGPPAKGDQAWKGLLLASSCLRPWGSFPTPS